MQYKILFFPVHFLSNIYMRMGQLRQIIYRIIGFTLTNIETSHYAVVVFLSVYILLRKTYMLSAFSSES